MSFESFFLKAPLTKINQFYLFPAGPRVAFAEGEGGVREGCGGEPVDLHARNRGSPSQDHGNEDHRDQR